MFVLGLIQCLLIVNSVQYDQIFFTFEDAIFQVEAEVFFAFYCVTLQTASKDVFETLCGYCSFCLSLWGYDVV